MISLNVHNVIDYLLGAALILCPYVFQFYDVEPARNVFLVLGIGLIVYSLFTNYRYSIARVIPLGAHMALDAIAGIALIFSPWIFDYRQLIGSGQLALHFIMGVGAIALVALTNPKSERALSYRDSEIKRAA